MYIFINYTYNQYYLYLIITITLLSNGSIHCVANGIMLLSYKDQLLSETAQTNKLMNVFACCYLTEFINLTVTVSRAWCKTIVTTSFYIRSYNSFAPSPQFGHPKLFFLINNPAGVWRLRMLCDCRTECVQHGESAPGGGGAVTQSGGGGPRLQSE